MKQPLDGRLLVSDIDGTLIAEDFTIPELSRRRIESFKQYGGLFTLATGRSVESARYFAELVHPNCPAIVLNGAGLYDYAQEKMLYEAPLPLTIRDYLAAAMEAFPHIGTEVYIGRRLHVLRWSREVEQHVKVERLPVIESTLEEAAGRPWMKILFADTPENLRPLQEFTRKYNLVDSYSVSTAPIYFEILYKTANKGNALKILADICGISIDKTYAIGDYYNDIELLQAAGVSAVSANAPDDLKKGADYISCHCNEGAVGKFIGYICDEVNLK